MCVCVCVYQTHEYIWRTCIDISLSFIKNFVHEKIIIIVIIIYFFAVTKINAHTIVVVVVLIDIYSSSVPIRNMQDITKTGYSCNLWQILLFCEKRVKFYTKPFTLYVPTCVRLKKRKILKIVGSMSWLAYK